MNNRLIFLAELLNRLLDDEYRSCGFILFLNHCHDILKICRGVEKEQATTREQIEISAYLFPSVGVRRQIKIVLSQQ